MCVCVCVCVRERECVHVRERVRVHVCVSMRCRHLCMRLENVQPSSTAKAQLVALLSAGCQ